MRRTSAPQPPRRIALAESLEPRQLLSGSIKGAIFVDSIPDGKRNPGEAFVPDIQVYLDLNNNEAYDAGEPLSITNARGKYAFKKLAADIYHVREQLPASYGTTTPPGGAWYVDLRFHHNASKKNFGYWPLALGPPPVLGKGPVAQNTITSVVFYNTGALQSNNRDGTNTGLLLQGDGSQAIDPYWVVAPPTAGGAAAAFQPTYYAYGSQPTTPTIGATYVGPAPDGQQPMPAGQYVYATAFDLTGTEPQSVEMTGLIVSDDQVVDVRLNGLSLAIAGAEGASVPLAIKKGFVAGVNTLEVIVQNNAAPDGTDSPTSPTSIRVNGLRASGQKIKPGAITLFNTGVAAPNAADGTNPTRVATGGVDGHWLVSTPGPGFPFYAPDTAHHYVYSNGITGGRFGAPFVASNSTAWSNDDLNAATAGVDSSFINPLGDANAPLPAGTYIYRTWFDLTGLNANGATLSGTLLADGAVVDIYINGNATGQGVGAGSKKGEEKVFTISGSNGMVSGINVLDFVVTVPTDGATSGLRVDNLHGVASGVAPRSSIPYPLGLPLPPFPPPTAPTAPLPTG